MEWCGYLWAVILVIESLSGKLNVEGQYYNDYDLEGNTTYGRLPFDLWPIHYNVELQPDIYTGAPPFYFIGSVDFRFECRVATNVLYLNNDNLDVDESSFYIQIAADSPEPGSDPVFVSMEHDRELQFTKVYIAEDLEVGAHYIIGMSFNGTMQQEHIGLFWSSYEKLSDGSTVYIVGTQFQAHYLRKAFVLLDEAQLKATFNITLVRKSHFVALTNGYLLSSDDRGNNWVADHFSQTQLMSPYLLCFVIGDFTYHQTFSANGKPIRIYGRPDYITELSYANEVLVKFYDYFELYTGIIDPNPKLDNVAVPGVNFGAMENWGLVLYGESTMVYNALYDTFRDQRGVADIIGHETAHLWFGDLVTCHWWNDAWLNEGFASFFQDLPYEYATGIPGNDEVLIDRLRNEMKADSRTNTEAVRHFVIGTDEPASSSRTYQKGAAVNRMIRRAIGEESYQRAIQLYLSRFAFSTVRTQDYWDALTDQAEIDGVLDTDGSKLDFSLKFYPWTDQRGFPLVTVIRTAPGTADVTQTHFITPKDDVMTEFSPYDYEWYVPLTITNKQTQDWSTDTKEWLNRDNKTITAGIPNSMTDWFVVNVDHAGFYRVKYDSATFMQLVDQLDTDATVIPRSTRFSLMEDSYVFYQNDMEPATYFFETTRFLDQEDSFLVWGIAEEYVEYPARILRRYPATSDLFERYWTSKVDAAYAVYGWNNDAQDNIFQKEVRGLLQWQACNYGHLGCEADAKADFDSFMADTSFNFISVDTRLTVYCTGVRLGTVDDWDALHAYYMTLIGNKHRAIREEIDRVLAGLACSEDSAVIQRYISHTFDTDLIDPSHAFYAHTSMSTTDPSRYVIYDHLKATWKNSPVPPGVNKWRIMENTLRGFATQADIDELESFLALYPPTVETETTEHNLYRKIVNDNKAWADANEPDLNTWLQTHYKGPKTPVTSSGRNHGLRSFVDRVRDAVRHGPRSDWYQQYKDIIY